MSCVDHDKELLRTRSLGDGCEWYQNRRYNCRFWQTQRHMCEKYKSWWDLSSLPERAFESWLRADIWSPLHKIPHLLLLWHDILALFSVDQPRHFVFTAHIPVLAKVSHRQKRSVFAITSSSNCGAQGFLWLVFLRTCVIFTNGWMHISQDREEIYFQYPHIYTAGGCFRRIDIFE